MDDREQLELAAQPAAATDTIHTPLTYGGKLTRFDGLSALALAHRNPGGAQWCAESRGDRVGRLCAEALAHVLGVRPVTDAAATEEPTP